MLRRGFAPRNCRSMRVLSTILPRAFRVCYLFHHISKIYCYKIKEKAVTTPFLERNLLLLSTHGMRNHFVGADKMINFLCSPLLLTVTGLSNNTLGGIRTHKVLQPLRFKRNMFTDFITRANLLSL